ncbi:MAG TPA: aldo/keto reductase [Microbacteriaceae bacterium]|nr:aldo/keto reductase [Microbacteriaceae bacterium]
MTELAGLDVFPLALGGNVFGWTADRDESFRILDAFVDGGGTLVDTADSYSHWVPGHTGGESETIVGQWLAARRPRNVVVATKVSQHPQFRGLSAATVRRAAEASLRRLGVPAIDLYFAHFDDPQTPLEETVRAFDALVTDGLVRRVAVSNYSAARIREWLAIADRLGAARPVAIQPHYNLVHRNEVEGSIIPLAEEEHLALLPYAGLASGFLTGKYRTTDPAGQASPRAQGAAKYATAQGLAVLDVLDRVAAAHGVSDTAVALAWLRTRSAVAAPIASASQASQVADLLAGARISLDAAEVDRLDRVSQWTPAGAR